MKPTAKAGDCVGDWLLKLRLGAGQSGVVWVAEEQVWPFRTGALKICCGAFVTIRKSRFRRESRFVRKRIAREHRTELYGWGAWNGFPNYVTELGEDLTDEMTAGEIRVAVLWARRVVPLALGLLLSWGFGGNAPMPRTGRGPPQSRSGSTC